MSWSSRDPLSCKKAMPDPRVTSVNRTGGGALGGDANGNSLENQTPNRIAATANGTRTGTRGEIAPLGGGFPPLSRCPGAGILDENHGPRRGNAAKTFTDCY